MFSFFSRKLFNDKSLLYPVKPYNYKIRPVAFDTNLSKYVIDTTNKIKKDYSVVPYSTNYVQSPPNSFLPIVSLLSFLAGYYLSKYYS